MSGETKMERNVIAKKLGFVHFGLCFIISLILRYICNSDLMRFSLKEASQELGINPLQTIHLQDRHFTKDRKKNYTLGE